MARAAWLAQVCAVSRFAVLTIPQRRGSSLAALFGIAGVVAVLVGVLSIAQGFERTMARSGSPDTVMVLRSGADSEMVSVLMGEDVRLIADAPGVLRDQSGAPLASGELFVIINLDRRSTGTDSNVPLRGVQPAAFALRRDFRIIAGRPFEWGRNEVVVGRGAAAEFVGLELGGSIPVGDQLWHVVGIFGADGGIAESEIWTDAGVLQPAYRRGNSFQTVTARLESAGHFAVFKDALTSDPRVTVKVLRQSDYYAEQSVLLVRLIRGLGTLIAFMMAVGAVLGALNTMYTAVSARTREIATLRALGFGAAPVVISVLAESLVLALLGAALGGGLAYLAFDGYRAATLNWSSFAQVAFAFEVGPGLLLQGGLYAVAMGLVGGLFPALRAARLPIAAALRES